MRVVLGSVISVSVLKFQIGTIHCHLHPPKLAVHQPTCAAIAEHIVGRGIALYCSEYTAQVIGIEESFSAGITRQGCEGLLTVGIAIELIENRLAGIGRTSAKTGLLCLPSRG